MNERLAGQNPRKRDLCRRCADLDGNVVQRVDLDDIGHDVLGRESTPRSTPKAKPNGQKPRIMELGGLVAIHYGMQVFMPTLAS